MFKILHITATSTMQARSGIPAVVMGLCTHQNSIDGVESRVLLVRIKAEEANSPFFDDLTNIKFSDYINKYFPDFVVFHDFYVYEYASFALYLKKKSIPFVLEPHGAFGRQAMKKSWLKKCIANNTLFRPLIRDSKGFIFTNEGERRDSNYKKNKVVVIPNGVEENVVDSFPHKMYDKSKSPIFYFMGRYDINHKGLDYLFDALDIIDKQDEIITVNMYGIGDAKKTAYVHERINRLSRIIIEDKGTVYDEDKVRALRNANILLLTSRYEGSPMTILDALSYGNPCLVTPGTNVADEIVNNGIGWKTELKAESIAECILRAQDDYKQNYASYYDKCRSYLLDNYLWDKIAIQSVEAYKYFII